MDAFRKWCGQVTDQVRFKPDRAAIAKELTAHYEDHVRDLERLDYPQKLAEQRALDAMGDPELIGKALNRVHQPWLGWLWLASRVVLILTLITAFVSLPGTGGFFHMVGNTVFPPEDPGAYQLEISRYEALNEQKGNSIWHAMGTLEAQSVKIPGYTLSLVKGAWWQYSDQFYRGVCLLRVEPDHLWYGMPDDVLDDLVMRGSTGVPLCNEHFNPFPSQDPSNWFSISGASNVVATPENPNRYRLEDSRDLDGWYLLMTMTTSQKAEWTDLSFPYGDNNWSFRIMWEESP